MGTYVYTFRKATRNILVDGVTATVQHLAYAYKPNYSFSTGARYERFVATMESHAQRSFEDYDGGYIIIADVKENGKRPDINGYVVYKGLKRSLWYDSNDHGMEEVGYLKKVGRSYHLIKKGE